MYGSTRTAYNKRREEATGARLYSASRGRREERQAFVTPRAPFRARQSKKQQRAARGEVTIPRSVIQIFQPLFDFDRFSSLFFFFFCPRQKAYVRREYKRENRSGEWPVTASASSSPLRPHGHVIKAVVLPSPNQVEKCGRPNAVTGMGVNHGVCHGASMSAAYGVYRVVCRAGVTAVLRRR